MGSQTLPTADEAERSVLGAVLLHPVTFTEVADLLHESDFGHPAHNAVYDAMVAVDRRGQPLDALTVGAEMKSQDTLTRLNAVGGEPYLLELPLHVISVENVRYHAGIIAKRARRRRCVAALMELVAQGRGGVSDDDFFEAMDRTISAMLAAPLTGGPRDVKAVLKEVLRDVQEKYERRQRGEAVDIEGCPTGYPRIDWMLGGLQAKFYIVAGRPSMGKTSMMLNMSANASAAGCAVLGFSMEMTNKEIVGRLLSSDAKIDGKSIERADLKQRDWAMLLKAASAVAEYPMKLEDISGLTFDAIRATARRWRMKHPKNEKGEYTQKAVVWVDYLQLIAGVGGDDDRKSENRQQEITRISQGMKMLSKELQCAVVALSQLNRGLENRDDKRPRMSDLRESGSLEQDADVVCFLYRDEVYSKDKCAPEDRGVAEFIVNKNRGGPTGVERLAWLGPYTRFENLSHRPERDEPPPGRYGSDA